MKKCFLFVVLLYLGISSKAQSGDFYLKEFTTNLPNVDNDNYAINQDNMGRMRIANRKGLLKFDGTFWGITHTPGTVFSVKYDSLTKLVYVGCINDFGYIQTDQTGNDSYVSLSKGDPNARNIGKIEIFGNFIYFLGESIVYEYSKNDKKITKIYKDHITNLFSYNKQVYACYDNNTISKLGTKSLQSTISNVPNSNIIFTIPINSASSLVGTSDNNLYVLFGNSFTKLKLSDSTYIRNCELFDAIIINEENAIIATSKGGCVIINIKTGQTLSIVNVYSGLPDNEVYAIGKDMNGGIWIAHEFGISRMDYNLPFKCYSNYLGWEGHLETAISYNGKLYLGTNEGLFVLEEIKQYKELIQKTIKYITNPEKEVKEMVVEEPKKPKKERFNFRNLLRRKHKDEAPEDTKNPQESNSETSKKAVRKAIIKEYISKKQVLESVKYRYVKVGDINAKCNQLIQADDKLIIATNSGIYELKGKVSTKLCNDNIRYLYVSKDLKRIYASTTGADIITLNYDGKKWNKLSLFEDINEPVTCIGEDNNGNLWLAAIDKVYKITLSGDSVLDKKEIGISNPFSDDIYIFNAGKRIYFSISSNYYFYSQEKNRLMQDQSLEDNFKNSEKVIYSQYNMLWLLKNKYWEFLSDAISPNENFIYISLFRNVDELVVDKQSGAVWVLTDKNQLYRLNIKTNTNPLAKSEILVHNIKNSKGQFLAINDFSVQQEESNLLLNVVSPDYYNQNALDYQYKISGYSNEWSHWSNSNTIVLNYLPSGDYTINVRSRNAFGQITEKDAVRFSIKPPFWQTWWFYLAEVVFFGGLWLLSFRLNRSGNTNEAIRKLLTFLTLVITIEFLSTVAENTVNLSLSPVVDFLMKVCIAVTLVPIERLLGRFIHKNQNAVESNSQA